MSRQDTRLNLKRAIKNVGFMFKGIFFDLGGTLVSYRNVNRTHAPLLLEAAVRGGVSHAPQAIKLAYGEAVQEITAVYAEKAYDLHREFFQDAFKRCFALLGATLEPAVETWYEREHVTRIRECLELKPDCHATLSALRAQHLYLSIASNIDDNMLTPIIQREGLDRHFHHWTSSEGARSCKPHRRFFEVCLEKSGLAAADVLFVGDSPEHDIAGAHAVGMATALMLNEGDGPPLQSKRVSITPDYTIRGLSELTQLV